MDRFFNTLRKTLVGVITLVFAFAVIYTPQPYNQIHTAAAIPVTEVGPSGASNITTAVQTTITAQKEIALDHIAFLLARTMISQMLQSLITWINSGFQGSPAFIQDLDRFLLDVADEVAGEYIQSLGDIGSFICSPFRLDIQLALAVRYQKARERRNIDSCTLSGIVDNVENFFNGQIDRRNFWRQWVEITSNPQTYTPYGQFMAAEAELNARIVNARGQQIQIANWGNGFLSNEICEAIEGPNGENQRCVISTPGRVIAEQLTVSLDSGRQQLVAADEINELISALLGQIANQAIMGAAGLLGLSAGTGYTSGGYGAGSYVDELARESYGRADSYLAENYEQVVDKLEVQEEYNALAIEYIPQLRTIANTTTNPSPQMSTEEFEDRRSRAQVALADAEIVRDESAQHIARLRPLVDELKALNDELNSQTVAVTEERRRAITIRQTQVINEASQYPAYTVSRLRVSAREWADITRS